MNEPESPDVRIFLRGVGTGIRFVIRNMGSAAARDVSVDVEPLPGKNSPLVTTEYESKIPIARLEPEEECELSAVVTTGTGIEFTARLGWTDEDGTEQSSEALLSV